jgi:hypothetical protein
MSRNPQRFLKGVLDSPIVETGDARWHGAKACPQKSRPRGRQVSDLVAGARFELATFGL